MTAGSATADDTGIAVASTASVYAATGSWQQSTGTLELSIASVSTVCNTPLGTRRPKRESFFVEESAVERDYRNPHNLWPVRREAFLLAWLLLRLYETQSSEVKGIGRFRV